MTSRELTETDRPHVKRGGACIVVAAARAEMLGACLDSILGRGDGGLPLVVAGGAETREWLADSGHTSDVLWYLGGQRPAEDQADAILTVTVDRALALLAPADVLLLSEPCRVGEDWVARMHGAAYGDTNTASSSALADRQSALALIDRDHPQIDGDDDDPAEPACDRSLHPRLATMVGPCTYIRRDALELVGALDGALTLDWALLDLSQRAVLAGLSHVAADDVLVRQLSDRELGGEPPASLLDRYPYLAATAPTEPADPRLEPVADGPVAASSVLPRALERARGAGARVRVTLDARGLGSAMTGTQRHVLELAKALAASAGIELRALVGGDADSGTLALLRALPNTEVLSVGEIDPSTRRDTVFHRPQQISHPSDLHLALRLGERLVLNQLDLIAYRNPSYHADGEAWRAYRRVNRQALAVADRVVVFSEHTRSEVSSDDLTTAGRIRVVAPGLDHLCQSDERKPAALLATEEGRSEDFMLCLGADYRHKNRLFALRLLSALREHHGFSGRLVLAGAHVAHGSSEQLERAYLTREPQLRDAILELGPVTEQERAWLMNNAAAVLYPSVYEGFGLVPLESGASGVPCVFARQSSLAEFLPAGAATIVPWDPVESAERVHALLSDPAARARNAGELAEMAQQLSWSATARAMLAIYREAAVSPAREAAMLTVREMRRERELAERIAAHDALVAQLVAEREHARDEYEKAWNAYQTLKAQTGIGLGLIGPEGVLPQDLQRALLALGAHRTLSGLLLGVATGAFRAARAIRQTLGDALRRR